MSRYKYNRRKADSKVLLTLFILSVLAFAIYLLAPYWRYVVIAAVVLLLIVGLLKRKSIARFFGKKEPIRNVILSALRAMDSTGHYYNNEDEANQELCSILTALGHKTQYKPYLGNNRSADGLVYGYIIEGKLSPNQNEIDRLIGQVSAYAKYPHKTCIVIYGQLERHFKSRLEDIISDYKNKIILIHLNNPRRLRHCR